jgi:capsular polysaccharide biosynthesis protein
VAATAALAAQPDERRDDGDDTMTAPDYVPSWPEEIEDRRSRGIWDRVGFADEDGYPAVDPRSAFASLAFIGAAIKRNVKLWCTFTIAGLLIGAALFAEFPSPHQATAVVLVKENPNEDPTIAIQTDESLAQSSPVAEGAIRQLHLHEDATTLLNSYAVLVVSNNVLKFTVNATSSDAAVQIASAVTTSFLKYRASYYEAQQQQATAELDQQFNQAQDTLQSVDSQIAQLQTQSSSSAQQAQLNNLQADRAEQVQIEQYVNITKTSNKSITYQMNKYTQVINTPAALPVSKKKRLLEDIGGGLVAGLAVGMLAAIIQALVSERLRRRDDIADALGAPVRLSVRSPRQRRWLPGRPRLADSDMSRVVRYLTDMVPRQTEGTAGLAVVAVDNADVVAPLVVPLAAALGRDGMHVALADLSGGVLARLLGVANVGIHLAEAHGTRVTALVPDPNDIAPEGPFQGRVPDSRGRQAPNARASQNLLAACASADLLIVFATLDPALGGDHLATWASDAVAVVSAGQTSATKIRAVGDMLRSAGTRLRSAVLIGADKSDESLGTASPYHQSESLRA